jgi:Ca2+-binding EF-hand superfamily protein
MKSQDGETITKEDLKDVFRMLDIGVSEDLIDFMIASVILDSEGLNTLQYTRFYEIF